MDRPVGEICSQMLGQIRLGLTRGTMTLTRSSALPFSLTSSRSVTRTPTICITRLSIISTGTTTGPIVRGHKTPSSRIHQLQQGGDCSNTMQWPYFTDARLASPSSHDEDPNQLSQTKRSRKCS